MSALSHSASSISRAPRHIAIVPAAGSGSRMGAERPKQYIDLNQRPLLWHALETLTRVQRIEAVCVVLAPDDEWWPSFDWSALGDALRPMFVGGATRAHSVSNALAHMQSTMQVDDGDWVLVHDAARACLSVAQVDGLIDAVQDDPVGGLLAVPVADTLKRVHAGDGTLVGATVPRDGLWQAQTPQMFRYGLLRRALAHHDQVTDEAGAVEALGLRPRLVAADVTNFKVTYPQDLALAAQILQSRK
ncbi:2-C-methyl-D-erythritol 4-phosphate cytidylyltransferase [Uliginosibacterium sp. H3]|uniref:2-C-methyl-D-erythritol 4-phosphate cytidylyltransferase n=1 Tax=Uliginosibacterium silvisoli TaxID=3114758 RepID=A0ABU6K2V2_9RHOO|nr:2-C-methyl-D-erythritol 4-phosphate cytidylyltransferase [Uliginosibacterium sp. H3]